MGKLALVREAPKESKTPAPEPKKSSRRERDRFAPLPAMETKKKVEPVATRVVPEREEQRRDTYSTVHIWLNDAWSRPKCTKLSNGKHAEKQAYDHVKNTYAKEWLGFKQNAPPCSGDFEHPDATKNCADYFSNESTGARGGFVFTVTADHAGYLAGWTSLNNDRQPEFPFTLYCTNGKWSFERPKGAPDGGPK